MIKVNLQTHTAQRVPLPQSLQGLKQESLNDLSWTDETLGLQEYGFWQEQDVTVTDAEKVLDGTEAYELDEANLIVNVTRGQRDKTVEELEAERKALVPESVTKRQGRQQMIFIGIIDQVQTAIDVISDPVQKALVQSFWDDSTEYERNHPQMIQLAQAIDFTDEQLDNAFIEAAKL